MDIRAKKGATAKRDIQCALLNSDQNDFPIFLRNKKGKAKMLRERGLDLQGFHENEI